MVSPPQVAAEDEGARADELGDLLVRRRVGHALGHDEGHQRRRLAERLQHQPVGFLQGEREGPGIDRLHLLREVHQLLAHGIARRPPLDRGDAVLGGDRLAVVEFQAVAQGEGVGELVAAHGPGVDHLRLDSEPAVDGEQRVVDHVAVVAHDVGGGPHRVEDLHVGMHDDLQRLRRRRGCHLAYHRARRQGHHRRNDRCFDDPHLSPLSFALGDG